MSAHFTPGPWAVLEDADHLEVHANPDLICEPHTLANARLIATAPELYEALEDLARSYASYREWHDDLPHSDAIDFANEVLAKARGEQVTT